MMMKFLQKNMHSCKDIYPNSFLFILNTMFLNKTYSQVLMFNKEELRKLSTQYENLAAQHKLLAETHQTTAKNYEAIVSYLKWLENPNLTNGIQFFANANNFILNFTKLSVSSLENYLRIIEQTKSTK